MEFWNSILKTIYISKIAPEIEKIINQLLVSQTKEVVEEIEKNMETWYDGSMRIYHKEQWSKLKKRLLKI